jgi:hypothetical protein
MTWCAMVGWQRHFNLLWTNFVCFLPMPTLPGYRMAQGWDSKRSPVALSHTSIGERSYNSATSSRHLCTLRRTEIEAMSGPQLSGSSWPTAGFGARVTYLVTFTALHLFRRAGDHMGSSRFGTCVAISQLAWFVCSRDAPHGLTKISRPADLSSSASGSAQNEMWRDSGAAQWESMHTSIIVTSQVK